MDGPLSAIELSHLCLGFLLARKDINSERADPIHCKKSEKQNVNQKYYSIVDQNYFISYGLDGK
jgi:hypothetical protein